MAGPHGKSRPKPSNRFKTSENENINENDNKNEYENTLNICTFNVRSLVHETRQIELECCLKKFKWDIIGLSEIKKEGKKIIETEEYIFMYFGKTSGRNGVGFLVNKSLKTNITDFKAISERVVRLDMRLGDRELSVIQCYAPTERAKYEDLEQFYNDIRNALENTGRDTIVMGDFNAKIGQQTCDDKTVMGPWGYGIRNERGNLLLEFCLENQLFIMNTQFKKHLKRKWTWLSPDGKTKNEIDFIMAKNKKSILDTETLGTTFPSDHKIVRAKYTLIHNRKSRKTFGSRPLQLNHIEQNTLKNIFDNLTESFNYGDIQKTYENLIKDIQDSTNKLQRITNKEPSPLTDHIKNLIEERRMLKEKTHKTRSEKNKLSALYKLIRKLLDIKRKERRYKIIEEELDKRTSVKRAQKRLDKNKYWITSLNKHKSIKTNRDDIIKIASDFFQNLYACEESNQAKNMESKDNCKDIPPLLQCEIRNAIQHLKSNKSPGADGVTNDILKAIMEPLTPILTKLFNEIINMKIAPKEWETSIITLLYKKGDPNNIGNYRPISLQQTTYKIFTTVILKRITKILESNQPREQAGFRPNYSTTDHIFTLTQVIENYIEYGKQLYIGFVDYSKAFDSIFHEPMWKALEEQGVEESYIEILKELYKNCKAVVKLERKGKPFPIERGVRQGDPISPNLFTTLLEHIFRNLNWTNIGININGEYLNHLRFADDIVLISEDHQDLEYMINSLNEESQRCGLQMNASKTFVMTNGEKVPISIQSRVIEYVDEYLYLGQNISFVEQTSREVERRIKKAWNRYWSLKEIFKSNIPIRLKKKAMDTVILPTLLYGCQSWALTKEAVHKIKVFQRAAERSMLGLKLSDRIKNSEIRRKTQIVDAAELACKLKWRWAGHLARTADGRWSEKILHWCPRGATRPRGRPRRRWRDDIVGVVGATWTRLAQQRGDWKRLEEAFAHKWANP